MSDTLVLNKDYTPLSLMPLSVISWQLAMKLEMSDKVDVFSYHDDWTVNSVTAEFKVPSIVITKQYVKLKSKINYTRANIFLRDGYTCQLCGTKHTSMKALSLDHVVPRSKGGKSIWTNMVTACKSCNANKGNDCSIVPKKKPVKPDYWDLIAQRRNQPVVIIDPEWATFLPWEKDLIIYKPKNKEKSNGKEESKRTGRNA
jgi:5-methylcytosine-specific restriction endonuclease McrA